MYGGEHKPAVDRREPPGLAVLAASFGGLHAIRTVLAALPENFPLPIIVVLHRAVSAPIDPLVGILARSCALPVRGAAGSQGLTAGAVTVLPAGQRVDLQAGGTLRIGATDGQRLSADTVMQEAAVHYGARAMAAVLTGKLDDGAAGTRAIKQAGGTVIVQDPLEAAAPSMPTAALATGCVDHQLPLTLIGPMLIALAMAPGAADLLRVPMAPWTSPQPG